MDYLEWLKSMQNDVVEIFKSKVRKIEKEEIVFNSILKNIEKIEERKRNEFILKSLLKRMFNFEEKLENELYENKFDFFSRKYIITRLEFEKCLNEAREEKEKQFLESKEVKNMLSEIKGELPNISARVYNINMGLFTKNNGEELTLKEYSEITGEDYETLLKILENAERIIAKKLKRRLKK